jgi:hypothetical protein
VTPGRGLFVQTLLELLGPDAARVRAIGIGQDLLDYDERRELMRLEAALDGEEPVGAR